MDQELKVQTPSITIKEQDSKSVLFVKGTHDHEASTSKASVLPAHTQQMLPHKAWMPKTTVLKSKKQPITLSSVSTKRWVPKTTLRAQGYYQQGAKLVWIPKAKPPTPPIQTKPPQMKKDTIPCASTTVNRPGTGVKNNHANQTPRVNQIKQRSLSKHAWLGFLNAGRQQ